MIFGDTFSITPKQRYEWTLDQFHQLQSSKKTLVEFCPNDKNDKIRPFFDFDGKATALDALPSPLDVIPHLLTVFRGIFGESARIVFASKENRTCMNKRGETEHKISLRVFVPTLYTYASVMKSIVVRANKLIRENAALKQLLHGCNEYGFDKCIYNRNRAMCLVTKPKHEQDMTILQKHDPSDSIEDFLITYLGDATEYQYDATQWNDNKKQKAIRGKRNNTDRPSDLGFLNSCLADFDNCTWEYEKRDNDTILFKPHTSQCLVSNKIHDKPQSGMFMNKTNIICSCFGACGNKELDVSVFRQIQNTFNVLILNEQKEDGPYQELMVHVHDVGENLQLKRLNGDIYRRVDGTTYAYEFWMSGTKFMNKFFKDCKLYNSSPQMLDKMKKYLKDYDSSRFPLLEKDFDYIGFKNGVLYLQDGSFIQKEQFAISHPSIVCRHYINTVYQEQLSTPIFDAFVGYQFEDEEVVRVLKALIGRLFFKVGSKDNWQVFPFVRGRPNSGKSTFSGVITAMFDPSSVGCINKTFEPTFGYSALIEKDVIISPDLPRDIFDRLNPQMLQSMVSGESISAPQKNDGPITQKWTVPNFFCANFLPDIDTNAEAQIRRYCPFLWDKGVPEEQRQSDLESRMINEELANIIVDCVKTYLQLISEYGNQSFWHCCPSYFQELRKSSLEQGSIVLRFLKSDAFNSKFTLSADAKIPQLVFKKALDDFVRDEGCKQKVKLNDHLHELEPYGIKSKDVKICKHCCKDHLKGCCENYKREDRRSQLSLVGILSN